MAEKLWYIYEEGLPIYVYQSKNDAVRAFREIQHDDTYSGELDVQPVFLSDLEEFEDEYRQEYDLALEEGYI